MLGPEKHSGFDKIFRMQSKHELDSVSEHFVFELVIISNE